MFDRGAKGVSCNLPILLKIWLGWVEGNMIPSPWQAVFYRKPPQSEGLMDDINASR